MFQIDIHQNPMSENQAFDPAFSADWAAQRLEEGYQKTGNWRDALRYYNAYSNFDSPNHGYNGHPLRDISNDYANRVIAQMNNLTPLQSVLAEKQGNLVKAGSQARTALDLNYPVVSQSATPTPPS